MAYYGGGFGGGMNMNALMQQAKKMQELSLNFIFFFSLQHKA